MVVTQRDLLCSKGLKKNMQSYIHIVETFLRARAEDLLDISNN